MKVSKNFVKVFLSLFLLVIIVNLIAVLADFYSVWMGYTLLVFFVAFWFLSFRKNLKAKEDNSNLVFMAELVFAMIVVIAVVYLLYIHIGLNPGHSSFYDIGSSQDANNSYLSPFYRVSGISNQGNITYRNITSSLVYFNVSAYSGEKINISIKLLDNFPNNTKMNIGIKDWLNGSYSNQVMFNSNSYTINETGKWIVVSANFSIESSNLVNGTANMLISIPHLAGDQTKTNKNVIPIDWINISA